MNLATVNINFLDKPMQWGKALYSVASAKISAILSKKHCSKIISAVNCKL
jgi:hypothetical protein